MVSHSPHFPSDLAFGSFLVYPSPAQSDAEKKAKTLILDLKRNAWTAKGSIVELVVNRLAEAVPSSCLAALLDGTSVFVPMPASAPLLRKAVWSNRSLCEAMVAHGLGTETREYISRFKPIRKSAFCALHGVDRPSPREHYDTLSVKPLLGEAAKIILVDDVITKGATFVGAAARVLEAFPNASVQAFAVSHTEKGMESWISPCLGHITCDGKGAWAQRFNQPTLP